MQDISPTDALRNSPLYAELSGSTCTNAGVTGRGHAPVLALCRQLLAAGADPDAALDVYRNGILALRIRRLADAAALRVRESTSDGRPRFARLNGHGVPPIAQNGAALPNQPKPDFARPGANAPRPSGAGADAL